MVCDVCGKDGARIRRVTETYGKGNDLLVIENVPLVVCPHCGESYFTADTLHEIERIRLHGKALPWSGPSKLRSLLLSAPAGF
jgi:YgiT-type zinc finger domain-containing protein